MDDCMGDYIAALEGVADVYGNIETLSGEDKMIQLSCCANKRFKQCIMNKAKQSCTPLENIKKLRRTNSVSAHRAARRLMERAKNETMDDLKSTLESMALTGPEFICSAVDEKFCRANFDNRFTGRLPRSRSVVPAMIKIYSKK